MNLLFLIIMCSTIGFHEICVMIICAEVGWLLPLAFLFSYAFFFIDFAIGRISVGGWLMCAGAAPTKTTDA